MQEPETYSVAEAVRVLGVSERRVRQLCEGGVLEARKDDQGRWRPYQHSVHARLEERPARTRGKRSRETPEEPSESAAELRERVEDLQRRLGRAEGRLELTEQTESTLRETLERERARADRLEDELREARDRLEERSAATRPAEEPEELQNQAESAEPQSDKGTIPGEAKEPERRSIWRRWFGG